MRVALPYLSILMPKVVLDQIIAQAAPERFLIAVGVDSWGRYDIVNFRDNIVPSPTVVPNCPPIIFRQNVKFAFMSPSVNAIQWCKTDLVLAQLPSNNHVFRKIIVAVLLESWYNYMIRI